MSSIIGTLGWAVSGLVGGAFSIVTGTLKTIVIGGIIVVVGAAGISTMTKPPTGSLGSCIESEIKDRVNNKNDNFIERGVKNLVAKGANTVIVKDEKDYGVVKVGRASIGDGREQYYVGTLNTWFSLPRK